MSKLLRKRAGAKKLLVFLSIFLFLFLFAPVASAAGLGQGDVNSDGFINVIDVNLAMRHSLKIGEPLTEAEEALADVDGEPGVKIGDVVLIMQYALGIIDEFPYTPIEVVSAKAINLREVVVVFNNQLDVTTAETDANYTANLGITLTNATLGADKKSVTLWAGSNLSSIQDTTVTIKNVKDTKNKIVANTSKTVRGIDLVPPTITEVEAFGPNTILVTFNEPVERADQISAYTLDAIPLAAPSIAEYVVNSNKRQVMITLSAARTMATGDHALLVNDGTYDIGPIRDFAGWILQPTTNTFTVAPDTIMPVVNSAVFIDQQTVRVVFNKPVKLVHNQNLTANQFYWNTTGTEGVYQYLADLTNTVKRLDPYTYNVKFTGTNYLRVGTVYFFAQGIEDYSGNIILHTRFQLTATASAALNVTGVTAPEEDKIIITFNSEVTDITANNKDNYSVKNSGAESQLIDSATKGAGAEANKVTLTMASNLTGGTYTVEIKNIKDYLDNTIVDTSVQVVITDTTPITSFSIFAVAGITKDRINVSYPEPMKTSGTFGIQSKDNYEYRINGGAWTSLVAADTITVAADGKSATIEFPDDTVITAGDNVEVRITQIADASDNIIASPLTAIYTAIDEALGGIDISILTPEITGLKTVKLTVPRHLLEIDKDDFYLYDGTVSYLIGSAKRTNSTSDDTAVIELTAMNNLDLTKSWQVQTNDPVVGTKDLAGLKIQANKISLVADDFVQPEVVKFSLVDEDIIRVQFSKDMANVEPADFWVTVGAAVLQPTGSGVIDPDVWDLQLPVPVDSAAFGTVYARTIAAPQSEDTVAAPNKLKANTTNTLAGNFKVESVALGKGTTATLIEGDETITITFSQAVDPESILAAWDGTEEVVNVKLYDTLIDALGNGAAEENDVIIMPGVGKLDWGTVNIFAPGMNSSAVDRGNLTSATYKLSNDKKTLTITLVGMDLSVARMAEGIKGTPVLTITNDEIQAAPPAPAVGDYINVAVEPSTTLQFATSAIFPTVNAGADRVEFLINWKYAAQNVVDVDLDVSDIYTKINAAHADFTNANGTFVAGVPGQLGTLVVDNANTVKNNVTVALSEVKGTVLYADIKAPVPSFKVSVAVVGVGQAITID